MNGQHSRMIMTFHGYSEVDQLEQSWIENEEAHTFCKHQIMDWFNVQDCKGNWKLDLAKLAGGPKINIL